MKWTHATGLLATCGLIAAGSFWAGCSSSGNGDDGGTDSGGNDVNQQKDTTPPSDSGSDGGTGIVVDASALDCNYYCTTDIAVCTGTNNQYKDNATCLSMCQNGIPNDAGAGATSGDSLACRMYHLSVAATSTANAAIHCPHTGPYGYGMCGSLCDDFCQQYFTSDCKTDTDAGYKTADACRAYCNQANGADAAAGNPGTDPGASGSSMLCREYHLENAIQAGGTGGGHCDHAGEGGAGICN